MMMRIDLCGGFGEKGRTSVAISGGGQRILLDTGIKVGASGPEYYPVLAGGIDEIDAVLISHAHEDHVGALSWLLSQGYRGRILMTSETLEEAPATLGAYADPHEFKRFPLPEERIELFEPGDILTIGGLQVATGRSGHVVGGVWFAVDDGSRKVVYSADVVPDSSVFVMDPNAALRPPGVRCVLWRRLGLRRGSRASHRRMGRCPSRRMPAADAAVGPLARTDGHSSWSHRHPRRHAGFARGPDRGEGGSPSGDGPTIA
jgi:glyoxylase-like metal-dependent hydrolase (beta-lactamase superfamily II)